MKTIHNLLNYLLNYFSINIFIISFMAFYHYFKTGDFLHMFIWGLLVNVIIIGVLYFIKRKRAVA